MARIVLNTFGSFGDIHPYLALAIALRKRGHDAIVATSEVYRAKVLAEGVAFAPVRPDVGELLGNEEFLKKLWDPVRGTEYLVRDYLLPALPASYADLSMLAIGADLLLTHAANYAGPIVAEKLNLRWLSVVLQPMLFLSAYDPPVLAPAPWLPRLKVLGPRVLGIIFQLGLLRARKWTRPIQELRTRVGLGPTQGNQLLNRRFSPYGTLALFSRHFAQPQPDWPSNVDLCGFPFYDREGPDENESPELETFLDAGPPPVLFTLGSSAVMQPGRFYRESFAAANSSGLRAVLLVGPTLRDEFAQSLPPNIHIGSYAPYSRLMPRCAAIVHQGGIGTTAQALRSGRPMIVVPWAHDQPDNAARIRKIGVGRTIPRKEYSAERVVRELKLLLSDAAAQSASSSFAGKIAGENGVAAACDAIERSLVRQSPTAAGSPLPK